MVTPTVVTQAVEPEPINYKRGLVYVRLTGFNAWLYRAMIWAYGEAEATERFWWLWHKKSGITTPDNSAQPIPLQGIN